jgi:benzodiazapine receptor|uniref:Tryptophan-rich sensory protein n=1 Tax=viral metagenome TaxID=1070528 RepID=A0A6C0CC61_9ZZZZ
MDKRIYLFIPFVSVNSVAYFYPISKDSGEKLWFRPPPYVFMIVWPILLLLIGYSWYLRPKLVFFYAILTLLLSSWSMVWNNSKFYAFINIICTLLFTLFLILYKYVKKSSILLVPLLLWLSFASVINYYST